MNKLLDIRLLIKIFLVGIIIHFFLHTFVTFKLGIDAKYIWLWKEFFILIFIIVLFILILNNTKKKQFKKSITILEIVFVLLVISSFISSHLIHNVGIGTYILAFKYDFLAFLIFFLFYHIGYYIKRIEIEKIIKFFIQFFKIILIGGVIWYFILLTMPGALKLFGYSRFSYEGELNQKPPAVYLTQEKHGIARNQFLFERPISYGFFLVMFFPLFYLIFLRNQKKEKKLIWGGIFTINIISTFSRAAIGAWIIEIIILGLLQSKHNYKKFFIRVLLPILLLLIIFSSIFYKHIFQRTFSDSGHIQLVKESINLIKNDFIIGYGAASAGPASHWYCSSKPNIEICKKIKEINIKTQNNKLKGFNTENQYLQILVEFGFIGLSLWLSIFIFLSLFWLYLIKKESDINYKHNIFILGLSLGVFGLLIEGIVLHSFVDRMIIYPAMVLYGLSLSYYFKSKEKI